MLKEFKEFALKGNILDLAIGVVIGGAFQKIVTSLVEDIIHKNPDINKNYESKLINKVNKVSSSLLIIDDDSLTRSIFKKAFSSYYNIIEAQNGEEAVEILGKYENSSYDKIVGIFLDLKMPVMDGFGVLDFLKEKRYLSKIPVIIVSADDTKDTKEKVYAYEIADMIEKPFNFEIIVKRVNNMIKREYSKPKMLVPMKQRIPIISESRSFPLMKPL